MEIFKALLTRKIFVPGIVLSLALLMLAVSVPVSAASAYVINGIQFGTSSGVPIQAHGGGMVQANGYYYWYGENRDNSDHFLGVACYRSADLKNWEYREDVLTKNSASELNNCCVERPKVIYNASTGKYVMWMHWENGINYGQARCAVAYADTPDGSFTYQGSFRPLANTGVVDHGISGYMSRDCTAFVDSDGTGYFISSSNENMDLCVYKLTPDYRNISSLAAKLFVGKQREAPCLFKRDGYYYLLSSGCTGWGPNQQKYAYSKSLSSGWSDLFNIGDGNCYNSQAAFVMPIQGTSATTYLYLGDRWGGAWGGKVNESQFVWLPITFTSNTSLSMPWYNALNIDTATGNITGSIKDFNIKNVNSGLLMDISSSSTDNGGTVIQSAGNSSNSQKWQLLFDGSGYFKIKNTNSEKLIDVPSSSTSDGTQLNQWTDNGGANQKWLIVDKGNGYYQIKNKNSGKVISINGSSTLNGAAVVQLSNTEEAGQKWFITAEGESTPVVVVKLGDVNNDSSINALDFALMNSYLIGKISNFPSENGLKAADVNGDGEINALDLGVMKQYLLGKISVFPAQK
jgi:hypothetical protein